MQIQSISNNKYWIELEPEWEYEGKGQFMVRSRQGYTYLTHVWQETPSMGISWDR